MKKLNELLEQLRNLDPNDPGRWPLGVRVGTVVLPYACALQAYPKNAQILVHGTEEVTPAGAMAAFEAESPGVRETIERYALGSAPLPGLACPAR